MTTALERAREMVLGSDAEFTGDTFKDRAYARGQLIATIAAALEAYGNEREAAGVRAAAHAALMARYGTPSSWGGDRPNGWTHRSPPTPEEAAQHDNGCVDAFKAIRALSQKEHP